MTEKQIRSEILSRLAELYEDALTRAQYKLFMYEGANKQFAERVILELTRGLAVEEKAPGVLRLTQAGYGLYRKTNAHEWVS